MNEDIETQDPEATPADEDATESKDAGEETQTEERLTELADLPIVTSDAELTFDEALTLAGRRGARLILPMGEIGTGKTTIMVELWTILAGTEPIAGYRCAGSRTAIALEERAFLSRMAAGVVEAETPRTQIDENEGLLHLRVARPDGVRIELLFADYAGERFRHIREGVPLLTELPWASRADRVAVLVDGSALARGGTRELAINHALRQIYALREANALHSTASLAVVLAKNDEVGDDDFAAAEARITNLLEEARRVHPQAHLIRLAARPADGSSPSGLDELLRWLCSDDPSIQPDPVPMRAPSRSIGRLRAAQ